MSYDPDIAVRVEFCHVVVEINRGTVVTGLGLESFDETGRVTRVCACLAIADLTPEVLAALSAATAEEQVIVEFVAGCCAITVEHRR